jgi:hypothetical protein
VLLDSVMRILVLCVALTLLVYNVVGVLDFVACSVTVFLVLCFVFSFVM